MNQNVYEFVRNCAYIAKRTTRPTDIYNKLVEFQLNETEIKVFNSIRKKNLNDFIKLNLKNVNLQHEGNYLLFQAIFFEKLDILEYLIDKGADLTKRDKYGRNAVQYALLYNKGTEIAEYLLFVHDFKIKDTLSQMIKNNVIKPNIDDINKQDETGSTILHYICARGLDNVFEKLKCTGLSEIKFDIKDKEGFTCTDRAAANGHVEMLKLLQQIVNFKLEYDDEIGKSILFKTLKYSPNVNVLKWWFMNIHYLTEDQKSKILFEVNGRTPDAINNKLKVLSENGIDYRNILDENGNSFIMKLAETIQGPIDLTRSNLIAVNDSNGINLVDFRNKSKQNALHIAAQYGNFELIDLAVTFDLDMGSRDIYGYSCYEYGVKCGHLDILRVIPKKLSEKDLLRLLNMAIINQRNEIFLKLLDTYPNFNLPEFIKVIEPHTSLLVKVANKENAEKDLDDKIGLILHIIKNCTLEYMIKLEKRIPFLKYSDYKNANILHILALFGRNDVILWLLLEKKYDILKIFDKDFNTALYYAVENKQIETVVLLTMFGLNFTNERETKLNDFNHITPFFDSLKSSFLQSTNDLPLVEVVSNIFKCQNKSTLIKLKSDMPAMNICEFNKSFCVNKQKGTIDNIYGSLENQYIITLKNNGLFKLGLLHIKPTITTTASEDLVPRNVEINEIEINELKIDLEERKTNQIVILDANENFFILIDKINKKDHQLCIYYWNKMEKKYTFNDQSIIPVKKWHINVLKFELINKSAWILIYNEIDNKLDLYRYIYDETNKLNKSNIFEKADHNTLGLKHTTGYADDIYLFTSDERFLVIYKPELCEIYFVDLNKEMPTNVITLNSKILDVKCIENSYDLIVKTSTSLKHVSVAVENNKLIKTETKIFEPICDELYVIRMEKNILIVLFIDRVSIWKVYEKKVEKNFEIIELLNSEVESDFYVTEDNNYLLFNTKNFGNKKHYFHVIDLNAQKEIKINADFKFEEFHTYDIYSVIMISDGVPYIFSTKNCLLNTT